MTLDQQRRLIAKRFNERIKLMATGLNTCAVASTVGVIIVPAVTSNATVHVEWILVAIVLHGAGQVLLTRLKSED